jgi:hypothetical protein
MYTSLHILSNLLFTLAQSFAALQPELLTHDVTAEEWCQNFKPEFVITYFMNKTSFGRPYSIVSLLKSGNNEIKFNGSLPYRISVMFVKGFMNE